MTYSDPQPQSDQEVSEEAPAAPAGVSEVTAQQRIIAQAEAEQLVVETSVLGYVQAGEAIVGQSLVGVAVTGGPLRLERGGGVALIAGEGMEVRQGGGQFLVAGGDMTVMQGGGQVLIAGGDVTLQQSGSGILIASRAELKDGFVALVLAGNVSGTIRVLLSTPQAAALGAAAGGIFGLIWWWVRGRR